MKFNVLLCKTAYSNFILLFPDLCLNSGEIFYSDHMPKVRGDSHSVKGSMLQSQLKIYLSTDLLIILTASPFTVNRYKLLLFIEIVIIDLRFSVKHLSIAPGYRRPFCQEFFTKENKFSKSVFTKTNVQLLLFD